MQIVIDIDDNTYTHLFNSGMEIVPQVGEILLAVKNGKPYKERKAGEWIVEKDCEGKTRTLICPLCKWKSGRHAWEDYNYCPNCGAKMGVDE